MERHAPRIVMASSPHNQMKRVAWGEHHRRFGRAGEYSLVPMQCVQIPKTQPTSWVFRHLLPLATKSSVTVTIFSAAPAITSRTRRNRRGPEAGGTSSVDPHVEASPLRTVIPASVERHACSAATSPGIQSPTQRLEPTQIDRPALAVPVPHTSGQVTHWSCRACR